jgi:hypothetical protein
MRKIIIGICLISLTGIAACATIGKDFPASGIAQIMINQSKRSDMERLFGQPLRTGSDSGNPTATYMYYQFGLFSDPTIKDLTITYTPAGLVKAYSFTESTPSGHEEDSAGSKE